MVFIKKMDVEETTSHNVNLHQGGAIWALIYLISRATQLFIQQLLQANSKTNIKVLPYSLKSNIISCIPQGSLLGPIQLTISSNWFLLTIHFV